MIAGYDVARAGGLLAIERERTDSHSKRELRVTEYMIRMRRVADNADLSDQVRELARDRQRGLERRRAALQGQSTSLVGALRVRRMAGRAKNFVLPPPSFKVPPPGVRRPIRT